jgi:hypothetical protein
VLSLFVVALSSMIDSSSEKPAPNMEVGRCKLNGAGRGCWTGARRGEDRAGLAAFLAGSTYPRRQAWWRCPQCTGHLQLSAPVACERPRTAQAIRLLPVGFFVIQHCASASRSTAHPDVPQPFQRFPGAGGERQRMVKGCGSLSFSPRPCKHGWVSTDQIHVHVPLTQRHGMRSRAGKPGQPETYTGVRASIGCYPGKAFCFQVYRSMSLLHDGC